MKHIIFLIVILFINGFAASGQGMDTRTKNQIKAKYYSAKELYEKKEYNKTIKKIEEIDAMVNGNTLASAQNLKVKAYIGLEEYEQAAKELYILEGLNLSESIIKEISGHSMIIENRIEAERKRQQAIIEKREREEFERLEQIIKAEKARRAKEVKIKEASELLYPEINEDFYLFSKLEEGRPYLVTYRSSLTSNSNESAYFIFYGEKYIIYTIPSESVVVYLNKNNVSFSGSDANRFDDDVIHMKIKNQWGDKTLTHFKKGIHYSNVFLGGFGDELMWTSGTQYQEFDKTLYYYYFYNTLYCDIELKTSFEKNYYNPYIETGTITKTVDYTFVQDDELYAKLKAANVKNKASYSIDSPNGLEIKLVPSNNIKMLYPQKLVTYKMLDKLKGEYITDGTEYKGTFLYFTPKTTSSHYGFIQYGKSFGKADLLTSVTGLSNNYIMSSVRFNSLYKSFNENIGNGKSRYFTNSDYTTPFQVIAKLTQGRRVSLKDLYGEVPIPKTKSEIFEEMLTEIFKDEEFVEIPNDKEITETPAKKIVTETPSGNSVNSDSITDDQIYISVDKMPEYPGGKMAMNTFIMKNLNYPEASIKQGISGRVFVGFIVNEDGNLSDFRILKGISHELDDEAMRVVELMPNWIPGMKSTKPVKVRQNIPIKFSLN